LEEISLSELTGKFLELTGKFRSRNRGANSANREAVQPDGTGGSAVGPDPVPVIMLPGQRSKASGGAALPATLDSFDRDFRCVAVDFCCEAVGAQMLIEGIPEKDWTPWQRERMRDWRRLWTRDDQWLRIEKWKFGTQQHTHDWVCFADIADACARRPGDIERDPLRRMQAYCDLQQSIVHGEFSKGGRLKVAYLAPQPPSLRDRVRLRLNAEYFSARPGRVIDHVLDLCWAPRELCLRWFRARDIAPPPGLTATPVPAEYVHAQTDDKPPLEPEHDREAGAPGASAPERHPPRASKDRIHEVIAGIYAKVDRNKAPNVKKIVPLVRAELKSSNETATWDVIGECAKDPRHAGKRRLRGRTIKSEQIRRTDSSVISEPDF
jgi:hypothetical protein